MLSDMRITMSMDGMMLLFSQLLMHRFAIICRRFTNLPWLIFSERRSSLRVRQTQESTPFHVNILNTII